MRNSAGLYNDGLTDSCGNNGEVMRLRDFNKEITAAKLVLPS